MGILPKLANAALVPVRVWIDIWRLFGEFPCKNEFDEAGIIVGRFAWTLGTALVPFLIIAQLLGL